MAQLNGTKVVVIGGASGVGFAVAEAALAAGADVIVGSSQTTRIEAAASKLGKGAKGITVDVKDEASVAAFFDQVGAFDHLIFTAGDWGHMSAPHATSTSRRARNGWRCGSGAQPAPPSTPFATSRRTARSP